MERLSHDIAELRNLWLASQVEGDFNATARPIFLWQHDSGLLPSGPWTASKLDQHGRRQFQSGTCLARQSQPTSTATARRYLWQVMTAPPRSGDGRRQGHGQSGPGSLTRDRLGRSKARAIRGNGTTTLSGSMTMVAQRSGRWWSGLHLGWHSHRSPGTIC